MYNHTNLNLKPLYVFLSAGFRTAPLFMEPCRLAVNELGEELGFTVVHSELLFPYGDWSRNRTKQSLEIAHDITFSTFRTNRSIGGARLFQTINQLSLTGAACWFVGHSGGGVASVNAAAKLVEMQGAECKVMMIGSPRCPIPKRIQPYTAYLYAWNEARKKADPFTRLGSWRGLKPALIKGVPMLGGHADYFRDHSPFVGAGGRSNLHFLTDGLRSWLVEKK